MRKFALFALICGAIMEGFGLIVACFVSIHMQSLLVFFSFLILLIFASIPVFSIYMICNRVEDNNELLQAMIDAKEPHQMTPEEIADQVDEAMKNAHK